MLKQIYRHRYGKPLLILLIAILALHLYSGFASVKSWQSDYEHYNSKKFEENFKDFPESYYDTTRIEVTPENTDEILKDFKENQLQVYYDLLDATKADSTYNQNTVYGNTRVYAIGSFVLLLAAASGFLLFFADLKTSFNQFLFSLGLSKKEIFWKKILYCGLPLILATLLSKTLMAAILAQGIPHMYLNTNFPQLMLSVISSTILTALYFAIGCFVGSLVGNLVSGTLVMTLLFFSSLLIPGAIQSVMNWILTYRSGNDFTTDTTNVHTYFVTDIGKTGGQPIMWLVFPLLTMILLFWASKGYEKISLEENGHFLLVPQFRWPIWLLMTVYGTIFITANGSLWSNYVYQRNEFGESVSITPVLLSYLLLVLFLAAICFVIVFFDELRRSYLNRRSVRFQQKIV